jgi:hypothetical protein
LAGLFHEGGGHGYAFNLATKSTSFLLGFLCHFCLKAIKVFLAQLEVQTSHEAKLRNGLAHFPCIGIAGGITAGDGHGYSFAVVGIVLSTGLNEFSIGGTGFEVGNIGLDNFLLLDFVICVGTGLYRYFFKQIPKSFGFLGGFLPQFL